jgi:hypothetical protein
MNAACFYAEAVVNNGGGLLVIGKVARPPPDG